MLNRKIESKIEDYLKGNNKAILLVDGARQVGKTYTIRKVCKKLFKNFIELNFVEDFLGDQLFSGVGKTEDFYMQLSMNFGNKLGKKNDTIIFLDEIQEYPQMLTLLKFLKEDEKFTYIASGSLLGITLYQTPSIPIGSIHKIQMYPLDLEEFLLANKFSTQAISKIKTAFKNHEPLNIANHTKMLDLFKKYLIVGGMPAVVKEFVTTKNMYNVRAMQSEIHEYYGMDASKYDEQNKLKIKTVYDHVPSCMENKKKRIIANKIENKQGATFSNYLDEFDYLKYSGITYAVNAISNPTFPLGQTKKKQLVKFYLNDVGILTCLLYKNNIKAILENETSVNMGSVYETMVAGQLATHGHKLYYYDNRKNGEVDFLIDDYDNLSVMPIEVKSGKDYYVHSALTAFSKNKDYGCKNAIVFNNDREIRTKGIITYMPVYFVMFL